MRDSPTAFGSTLTAGYTSEGVRAWKQSGGVRTYFVYDGADPVVELDGNGYVKAVNTFGAAGLVSRYNASAGTSVFYTFDETGNVSQRFDGTGALLSTHAFQAYGRHGSTLAGNANPDPWGYKAQSGYYTDQETGLVLCTFRYYDPANGRWLNRDPIGYAGGLNLYAYCIGNPVNFVDPYGLREIDPFSEAESWGPKPVPTEVVIMAMSGGPNATNGDAIFWGDTWPALNAACDNSQSMAHRSAMGAVAAQGRKGGSASGGGNSEPYWAEEGMLYRGGDKGTSNVRPRPGKDDGHLSVRTSPSNPITGGQGEKPPLPHGEYIIIDPKKLPPGSVIYDNVPPGHASIYNVDPEIVKGASIKKKW